ncbi:MAG TPA: UvrD-helicase domain-containing protein [Thermoanaerobaculia bacterium]|nr:UvrD-helicase domain-containing protein [Thermoanaerobaculia bacterium]
MSRPLPSSPPLDLAAVLNPEQIAAVTHGEGHQLVLAGAGSGKTRVITYRISWLVQEAGVAPERIAAVTFTNKAAAEMRGRVEDLLGLFPLPTFVGTFHRFALVLLRRYGERVGLKRDFAILDTTDQLGLVKSAIEAEGLSEKSYTPRSMLAAISSAKNRLLTPDAFEAAAEGFVERKMAAVYRRYQGLLHSVSGVDFDDMIALAVRLLTREEEVGERVRGRLAHLLVDEYQDTNHAQLELIRALVGDAASLTAVGDEDQSIYRWRGAEIDNILSFERSFPGATIRKLERNYRSTQTILDASGALVARNERRRGKRLWTEAGPGDPIELYKADDEGDEARWIVNTLQSLRGRLPLAEMAILVRTNAQTRALEDELVRQEVPYVLVGGTRFYDRAEIKDLVAYLKVIRNPRDAFSFARILNQPPRGIGKTTEEMLRQEAAERGLTPWDVIAQEELGNFPARAAAALRAFGELVKGLRKEAEELPLPALLDLLLARTGYAAMYQDKRDPESEARLENVRELLSAAQEFTESVAADPGRHGEVGSDDLLTAFLDHVSLVADIDGWQAGRGVSVMTLHSAKGLEFRVVVTAGLEQGLLPHFNAQGTPDDVEEERRLLYVGMTRAKERLILTCCRRRRIAGRYQDQLESPFLRELPEGLLTVTESPSLFHREPAAPADRLGGVYSFFGREEPRPAAGSTAAGGAPRAIRKGSRVDHPVLGEGVVLATEGSGDQEKITVFFQKAGKKKLLAKYANLELV